MAVSGFCFQGRVRVGEEVGLLSYCSAASMTTPRIVHRHASRSRWPKPSHRSHFFRQRSSSSRCLLTNSGPTSNSSPISQSSLTSLIRPVSVVSAVLSSRSGISLNTSSSSSGAMKPSSGSVISDWADWGPNLSQHIFWGSKTMPPTTCTPLVALIFVMSAGLGVEFSFSRTANGDKEAVDGDEVGGSKAFRALSLPSHRYVSGLYSIPLTTKKRLVDWHIHGGGAVSLTFGFLVRVEIGD